LGTDKKRAIGAATPITQECPKISTDICILSLFSYFVNTLEDQMKKFWRWVVSVATFPIDAVCGVMLLIDASKRGEFDFNEEDIRK
jgi:hypothetical protein